MAKGLFDHINQIVYTKDKNYFDKLSHEDKMSFNTFMIIRMFSRDIRLTETMAYLNKFQNSMSREQMYLFLIEMVPQNKYNFKVGKKHSKKYDDEIVDDISFLFGVSKQKSYEYLNILDDDEINLLRESLGK